MIEDTPYIIVDNRKIQPIRRSPRPDSATEGAAQKHSPDFGVVDRVTLSREGLEKSRQQVEDAEVQPLIENRPGRITTPTGHPLLTYSPKG